MSSVSEARHTGKEPLSARAKISAALNLLIALAALCSWCVMVFHIDESGRLSASGLASLKYFTVLSNLLMAAAGAVWAVQLLRGRTGRQALVLKYAGTVSVTLTFVTVMVFLGPLFGYAAMFMGGNLYLHLVVPLAALADFLFLCREGVLEKRDARWATLPMLLYGIWYVGNNLINGHGAWPNTNDFYGFFTWGDGGAALIAVIMVTGTWGMARLLHGLRKLCMNRK